LVTCPVRLPASAPIGKEISVFSEVSSASVTIFGDSVLSLSFPFLMGSANQQTGAFSIFAGESYVFTSLGNGLWKVNSISKTIMTGSAATSATTKTIINATNVSVLDTTTSLGNSLFKDSLRFIRDNGSGVNRRIDLLSPTTITSDRTITLPDATGTVALTSAIVTKSVKVTLSSADLLGLNTTPKVIIPAVSGKIIIPTHMYQNYTYNSASYNVSSNATIGYQGSSPLSQVAYSQVGLTITPSSDSFAINSLIISWITSQSLVNTNITLVSSTAITSGNGTLDVYVTYFEIDA
jgi:hypothetical protein